MLDRIKDIIDALPNQNDFMLIMSKPELHNLKLELFDEGSGYIDKIQYAQSIVECRICFHGVNLHIITF